MQRVWAHRCLSWVLRVWVRARWLLWVLRSWLAWALFSLGCRRRGYLQKLEVALKKLGYSVDGSDRTMHHHTPHPHKMRSLSLSLSRSTICIRTFLHFQHLFLHTVLFMFIALGFVIGFVC